MSDVRELVVHCLSYEVWMLDETHKRLLAGAFEDEVNKNALIESFCIHARNLNELFLENGRDDTLRAGSVADGDYKRPSDSDERRALFTKINKQISHITKQRTTVADEKIGDEDRGALLTLIVADLKNFLEHLKPELPAWKPCWPGLS